MLKKIILLSLILTVLSSCEKEKKPPIKMDSYVVSINIDNVDGNKVYLQDLNTSTLIDSTLVKDGSAIFKGKIAVPERYLITIENVFGGKIIILENDSINVYVKDKDLLKASISGSKLNNELNDVLKKTEKIYSKLNLFYPDLQRARIENDADKLASIKHKMKGIVQENLDFHFNYVQKNPNSFVSAMILRDLIKRDSIDTNKVENLFNSFSSEVKKSSDAQKIALFLETLH